MDFLEQLASRRRFGMKAGLDSIKAICDSMGAPHRNVNAIHIAGTNGKGACAAITDSALTSAGLYVGRYTSPHLLKLNERFFLAGKPVDDKILNTVSNEVESVIESSGVDATFFEALTAVAFKLYSQSKVDALVLETGLGGRLDATNICNPVITAITRIGLDHCDWLGGTVEDIAMEKAGIIKSGVPVVLGENALNVRNVVEHVAEKLGCEFYYAPDIVDRSSIPSDFALSGSFNIENAVTASAILKVIVEKRLLHIPFPERLSDGFAKVKWPGRFQKIGNIIIDGAHNPPAAKALLNALDSYQDKSFILIAGFCSDKDITETLSIIAPKVKRAIAVKTNNPRSINPSDLAYKMNKVGIDSETAPTLQEAISRAQSLALKTDAPEILVCGSLFLAGQAIAVLNAYPWGDVRFDPSEILKR